MNTTNEAATSATPDTPRDLVCDELETAGLRDQSDEELIRNHIWAAVMPGPVPQSAMRSVALAIASFLEGTEFPDGSVEALDYVTADGVVTDDFWNVVQERLRQLATQRERLDDIADQASLRTEQRVAVAEVLDRGDDDDDVEVPTAGVTLRTDNKAMGIDTLMALLEHQELLLDPAWQRGDVWSVAKKRRCIESILRGIPLPSIILSETESGNYEVIDGKQRLSAIAQFIGKHPTLKPFALETFGPSHVHAEIGGKKYAKIKDTEITFGDKRFRVHRIFSDKTQIFCLIFKNAGPQALYEVFKLYNTQGVPLKPGEIRNEVFQDHRTHGMLFTLAGERARNNLAVYLADEAKQSQFTQDLRELIGARAQDRYKTLKFLSRYASLAYWQEYKDGKPVFRSTEKHIDQYFLHVDSSGLEETRSLAREIVDVFDMAIDVFGEEFFKHNDRWNELKAVTALLAARLMFDLRTTGVSDDALRDAVRKAHNDFRYPRKQQGTIIWAYHACFLHALVKHLGVDASTVGAGRHKALFDYLKYRNDPALLAG